MFNNKFNSSKKDPLVEAVQNAMQDGDLRRQAIAYVNEQFGVFSRNAVVNEHKAAYDAALEEAYKSLKEGNDGNLANNYPPYDKVTRGDVIAGRLGKDQMGGKKKMDEKKDCYEEGTAEAETSMNVTSGNKPYTPAQTTSAPQDAPMPPKRPANLQELKKPTAKTAMDAYHRAYDSDVRSGGEGKRTARLGRWMQKNLPDKSARNQKDTDLKEAIARKKDIAKGGVTAPIEYADKMGFANPGAISKLDEAWNRLKEARKCMEEESYTFDFSHLDEAYANYIAEAINEYGLQEEHPVVTAENLYMFNEAYIAAVLGEAAKHEKEKAEDHEEKAKELDEARMRAEKEEHDEDTKKRKVLTKTLKHIARKKAMAEELQIDEVSAFGQAFRAAGGKNFSFGGKTYSGARADGKTSTPAAKSQSVTTLAPTAPGAQAKIQSTTTQKGLSDPGRWENEAKAKTGSMQQIRGGKVLPPSSQLGTNPNEKSTQSFLNKELGKTTQNAQGPEAPSTSKPVPTPPSRPTFSSDLPKIDTGPKLNPQGPGLANQPSSAPKADVPTPPSRPPMASDLPKIDTGPSANPQGPGTSGADGADGASIAGGKGGKGGKGGSSINESVQIGDRTYRIV